MTLLAWIMQQCTSLGDLLVIFDVLSFEWLNSKEKFWKEVWTRHFLSFWLSVEIWSGHFLKRFCEIDTLTFRLNRPPVRLQMKIFAAIYLWQRNKEPVFFFLSHFCTIRGDTLLPFYYTLTSSCIKESFMHAAFHSLPAVCYKDFFCIVFPVVCLYLGH